MMKRKHVVIIAALIGGVAFLALQMGKYDPLGYTPMANKGFMQDSVFAQNSLLANKDAVDLMSTAKFIGAETVAFGPDAALYAGFHYGDFTDGGIMRMQAGKPAEVFANTGAWVAGIRFDKAGNLLAMVLNKGLMQISPDGKVTPLVTHIQGKPITIPNDLVIAQSGLVYFTLTSSKYPFVPKSALRIIVEARQDDGGLYSYDPNTKKVSPILEGFHFINGVELAPDESYLLFAETGRYRVMRHWLQGPKSGKTEVFIDNLPGFPNGIKIRPAQTGRGASYWLGFSGPRDAFLDSIHDNTLAKRLLLSLPEKLMPKPKPYGLVMLISEDENGNGKVLRSLHDPEGKFAQESVSVIESKGALYIGADRANYILKYTLPSDLLH